MAAPRKKKPQKDDLPMVLPDNFSAECILDPLNYRKDLHVNLKAAMYFILHSIISMSQRREGRDFFDRNAGYPLHTTILNHIIGKNYTIAIDLLEKSGVITRTRGYQTGEKTKLFTITKEYTSTGYKIRSFPKDAASYKRLLQYRLDEKTVNEEALSKIRYITQWFDPTRLNLDRRRANSLIEFYLSEMRALIPDPLPKGRTRDEIEARINLRVNSMIDTFNTVTEGHMGLKKTGQDNRLHSVVSNTKKELRGLYSYDGKPMVSIDIKASQPYLLTILLNPKSWGEKGVVSKVFPELYTKITSPRYKSILDTILMFGTFSKSLAGKEFRKTGFFKFQWETDFYLHLVDLAKAERAAKVFPNRASVKKKMMMILFDDAPYMLKDKGFRLFSKWFPEEASMISLLKSASRDVKNETPDEDGLSFLPILLQRLESYLMLEKVCKKISKEIPDAPIIPVHDCIMTTPEYSDRVAEIVRGVLKKETELVPGVTIDKVLTELRRTDIQDLAAEDLDEILATKPKGQHIPISLKPILRSKFEGSGPYWYLYLRGGSYSYYDPEANNVHFDVGLI